MLKVFSTLLCLILLGANAHAQTSLIARMESIESSIVEIKTVYTKTLSTKNGKRRVTYERNGAGVVIDPSGLIVTNTHIIKNAPFIYVILRNGTSLQAQVPFVSNEHDFSFLKISPTQPLKPISWADSSRARLGQDIVAIGNSDYDNQSILGGQIVNLIQSRSTGSTELIGVNLQLYQGDSGGPILDEQGRLLGIIMAKEKNKDRSCFAIASNKIREQYWHYKRNMP